jgi:uncharacterized protein YndB with AHSA1/START domain/effector-binding domain-containing protein
MTYPDSFQVTTPTDREIVITRDFQAPRQMVFDAFTKPELVRRWLLGPPGWTMPVCEIDLRVGGVYRYVWRKDGVKDMGMGGKFREVEAPHRVIATERFDDAWYAGEALNTTTFVEAGGITKTTIVVRYESQEARDTARRSGMEHGVKAGYDRLEELLLSRPPVITVPEITETEARIAAIIHLTIPRDQMRNMMPAAINEVVKTLADQAIAPAGPLFAHHLTTSADAFDFEVGFPVSAPVQAFGRVKAGELPGGRIARAVFHGRYEGLFEAWREFGEWMKREGYTGRGDLWEIYVAGPESSPDPKNWRTELCLPLKVSRP